MLFQKIKVSTHLKLLVSGSLIMAGGNIFLGLINYLIRKTMADQLLKVDYGCFYGAFSLFSILLAFLDLGVGNAGTVLIAEQQEKKGEIFSLIFLLKLLSGLIVATILFFLRNFIANSYLGGNGSTMLGLLAFFVLFNSLNGAFVSYYNGNKFYQTGILFRCSIVLLLWVLIFLLTREFATVGAAAAYLLADAIFCPLQLIWVCRNGKFCLTAKISFAEGKRFLALIGIFAVITCMQTLLFNMDSVMLTWLRGPETTAVYNVALPITQLLLAVLVLAPVFLPIAVDMAKQRQYDRLRHYVTGALFCTLAALPCVFWGSRWCGDFLVALFFKESYVQAAAPVLPWLMSGYLLFSFGAFVTQILIVMRCVGILLWISGATVIGNFAMNYYLILRHGASGAAIATFASYLLFAMSGFCCFLWKNGKYEKEVRNV